MKKSKKLSEKDLEIALTPLSDEQINSLNAKDLRIILKGEQKIRQYYEELAEKVKALEALNEQLKEKVLVIEGVLVRVKSRLFSPKSEKTPRSPGEKPNRPKTKGVPRNRNLLERYPNAEVIEQVLTMETPPQCSCCSSQMEDSGMYEESHKLTVIPKKYLITKLLRLKYRCSTCHGDLKTTPALPSVVPRSSYDDGLIIDAALSKYCDLIPMERYCAMAKRQGFTGLPPQSLIGVVSRFAEFLRPVYELIRQETLDTVVLLGDETPHKMLEGSETKRWYLWGFSSSKASFFECHDTRSGDVACDILSESWCTYFMSDAYSGYSRAISETNSLRKTADLPLIIEVLCNAHARREFYDCQSNTIEAEFFIKEYKAIYKLEEQVKELTSKEALEKRQEMAPHFMAMKEKAQEGLSSFSTHSAFYKACQYFLNHYAGLTVCLGDIRVPLDNNQSERLLRSPVVGRKTWYGTHSEDGAETAAIHFTLVESCKMIQVNPRDYYQFTVNRIHSKGEILTPNQYKDWCSKAQESD